MANEWLFPTEINNEENVPKSKHEDLFVFGYACKLFRDDEQARAVDKGTYMIPWMGDERLQIDRYDGRGHLYDLTPYDADIKGRRMPELTEDEQNMEKLCDEERYLELHTDIAEKAMYEEEEWKRYYESLEEGYKAVGFSYDAYGQQVPVQEAVSPEKPQDPGEQPYVPPESLQVPEGMEMPATNKEQAIIEKTAKFIAEHGVQMEIMMKAKQANNTQFEFMHFENTLHPYYRHLVKMIKSKKYIPAAEPKKEDPLNDSWEADEGHGYLHPILLTTNRASPTPEVYKPIQVQMPKVSIHETSYGQLLQSLSKVDKTMAEKQNRNKEAKMEVKQEPLDDSSLPSVCQYAQDNMPPPPGIEPVTLPSSTDDSAETTHVKQEEGEDSNGSTTEPAVPMPQIVPPPPDAQPVVDRMAMYVARNGAEFELVVKSKNDQRFQFLEQWHVHYGYYLFKKQLFIQEMERERKEKELEEKKKEREKAEKLAKGVKFKLKKAKDQEGTTLEKKKVFDNDESSDEEKGVLDGEGVKERKPKSDRSGTATPITDTDAAMETKNDELLEKKLAEQKVKDRLAASAREKLSQVDKEKQIKAERKKKAAMFINLLKSKTGGEVDTDNKTETKQTTPNTSAKTSPSRHGEKKSSNHKSKRKTRDRSKDRRSRSRSRSRSKSKSRSKKKRRHRSPTPPSAYAVSNRRSPLRRPPPPPPSSSRYGDLRPSRYSRSPSQSKRSRRPSRSRSRSPPRSKSKKKKRSRSPRSKHEDTGRKKSSKKKKKKSRSRSRSRSKVTEASAEASSKSHNKKDPDVPIVGPEVDPRVISPAAEARVTSPVVEAGSLSTVIEELEDGETQDSSPEPGELQDPPDEYTDQIFENSSVAADGDHIRTRSPSDSFTNKSRTSSPASYRSSSRSRSPSPRKHSDDSDKSRSPSVSGSPNGSKCVSGTSVSENVSREGTPNILDRLQNGAGDIGPNKNVSPYMLSRVRELLKASKKVTDEEMETDGS